jgi:hypothetical protein
MAQAGGSTTASPPVSPSAVVSASSPVAAGPSALPVEPPPLSEARPTPAKAAPPILSGEEPPVSVPPTIEVAPVVSVFPSVAEGVPPASSTWLPSPTSLAAPLGAAPSDSAPPQADKAKTAASQGRLLRDTPRGLTLSIETPFRRAGDTHSFLLVASYQVAAKTSSPRRLLRRASMVGRAPASQCLTERPFQIHSNLPLTTADRLLYPRREPVGCSQRRLRPNTRAPRRSMAASTGAQSCADR